MLNQETLDALYAKFNHRKYASPDPLEVVYRYDDPRDQEVVAFLAAMLAYGRVASIIESVDKVLKVLGEQPYEFLVNGELAMMKHGVKDFKHRWTKDDEMLALLMALRSMLRQEGSLEAAFVSCQHTGDESIIPALGRWTRSLDRSNCRSLVSKPERGSACKRLHMFLRWMVRSDEIDLGLWTQVKPAELFVPLDTHMFRVCKGMGLTMRKQANFLATQEVTRGFKKLCPEDPVKYDFALTRLGIRKDESMQKFLYENRILKR